MHFETVKGVLQTLWESTLHAFRTVRAYLVRHLYILGVVVLSLAVVFTGVWFKIQQPPASFPVKTIITIPEGTSVSDIATILKDEQVIRSRIAFSIRVRLQGLDTKVKAGEYYFDTQLTLPAVVERVTTGTFGLEPIRIRIPEGSTTYQMAHLFEETFEEFNAGSFLLLSEDKEGYLFPDTYFFLPNVTTTEVLQTMERTFYERLRSIEDKIASFGKPVHEVVTMASLLEKEARDYEERRVIAGILWKRLQIHMPLQVDAVFGFIEKTDTFSPNFSHLEIDSVYNTYKYNGLPPGPIGSPSLEALEASVSPVQTDALFYLHGRDGELYTAQTYEQHLENRRRYLD